MRFSIIGSYYDTIHCRPCINDWRRIEDGKRGRGKNRCPFCRGETPYEYVITPQLKIDEEVKLADVDEYDA